MTRFLALDFETADQGRDSACAVGLVRVENGREVDAASFLIRPPRRRFIFTHIHGITWNDVRDEPTFDRLWPRIRRFFRGVDFVAAHNAAFDRSVLEATADGNGVRVPRLTFVCSMAVARRTWGIFPTRLQDVCDRLGIKLRHHDALSDARACAKIICRALRAGAWIS